MDKYILNHDSWGFKQINIFRTNIYTNHQPIEIGPNGKKINYLLNYKILPML